MINPKCDMRVHAECEVELQRFGGLLFSPPDTNGNCRKLHACVPCYRYITALSNVRGVHL